MPEIEVFDPALCCSTGVCGPEVDADLVRFAADVDSLHTDGVVIRRFNLSSDARAFMANAVVRTELQQRGVGCLPLVVVDGAIRSSGTYPSRSELIDWAGMQASAET
jgi:hypothetical protein